MTTTVAKTKDPMVVLENVKDPEIPELSVVDLGIVRDITEDEDGLVVTITPTYSGCPAYEVIEKEICGTLEKEGFGKATVRRRMNPAWTTDWISKRGKETLRRIGIAPPGPADPQVVRLYDRGVPCPRCGEATTRLVSEFGATACKSIHYCNNCLEPFEHFKET